MEFRFFFWDGEMVHFKVKGEQKTFKKSGYFMRFLSSVRNHTANKIYVSMI